MRRGMGGHQSAKMKNDEWLTPPDLVKSLGEFDLDPCSPIKRPWDLATKHYSKFENGLVQPWEGRVWLNPPYGLESIPWIKKLYEHGDGIALIFARTETNMFFDFIWGKATGILFIHGRLYFHLMTGERAKANGGAPSCLVAYGQRNLDAIKQSKIQGYLIE